MELADGALRWAVFNSALDVDAGDGVILGSSSLEQIVANAASIEGGPLPLEVGAGPGHTRLAPVKPQLCQRTAANYAAGRVRPSMGV